MIRGDGPQNEIEASIVKHHNTVAKKLGEDAGRESDPTASSSQDAGHESDLEGIGEDDHLYIPPRHADFKKGEIIFWNISSILIVTTADGEVKRFHLAFVNAEGTPNKWGVTSRRGIIWSDELPEFTAQQLNQLIHHEDIHDEKNNPPLFVNHGAKDYCTPENGKPFITFVQRVQENAPGVDAKIVKIDKKLQIAEQRKSQVIRQKSSSKEFGNKTRTG